MEEYNSEAENNHVKMEVDPPEYRNFKSENGDCNSPKQPVSDPDQTALNEVDGDGDKSDKTETSGSSKSVNTVTNGPAVYFSNLPTLTKRNVTLQMLLAAGILKPGEGTMSLEYHGQKFVGDLLENGQIKSQETSQTYSSPSAWAIACKQIINPEKILRKSGCGWASIKYRSLKLDYYKTVWFKRVREGSIDIRNISNGATSSSDDSDDEGAPHCTLKFGDHFESSPVYQSAILSGSKVFVSCSEFKEMDRLQPFHVKISAEALALADFHCNLTNTEAVGYISGQWNGDQNILKLEVAHPCRILLPYSGSVDCDNERNRIALEIQRLGHEVVAPSHRSSGFVSVDETSSSSVLTDEDDESDVSEVSPFDETEDSTESSDSWIQNMKSKFDGGESILKLAPKLLHNTVKMIRDAGMEWICGDLNVTEEDLTTLLEFFEKTCDEIEKDSRDNKTTSSKRANADDGAGLSYNKRRKIIKDPQTNADILEQDLFLDKSFINYDPVLKRFSCMAENCPNSDGKFILANFAGHLLYEHFKGTFVCSEQINGKKCLKKHAQRHQLYQHLHKQHKIGVRDDRLKNLNQQNPHYVQLVKYLKALQNVEDSKTFVGAPTHKTRKARPGAFLNESPALDQIKEWMKDFDGKEAQVFQDAWEGERPLFSLTNGTLNIVGSTKDASGWYHSHPKAPAEPTKDDITRQLDYQVIMKGASESSYIPCIGLIISPVCYSNQEGLKKSKAQLFWVMPPPENRPMELGRPMHLEHDIFPDNFDNKKLLLQMGSILNFYKERKSLVDINDLLSGRFEKLKLTVSSWVPEFKGGPEFWNEVKHTFTSPVIVPPPPPPSEVPVDVSSTPKLAVVDEATSSAATESSQRKSTPVDSLVPADSSVSTAATALPASTSASTSRSVSTPSSTGEEPMAT